MLEYCLSEKVTETSKETYKEGSEQAVERSMLEYSVENVLEMATIRSVSDTVVSKPDKLVDSGSRQCNNKPCLCDIELHEKQSIEEENSDENLGLLPEFLDRLIASGTVTEFIEIDIQTDTDLKIVQEIFVKLTNGEIDLESVCSNSVCERLQNTLDQVKKDVAESRTAKSWLLFYLTCILF